MFSVGDYVVKVNDGVCRVDQTLRLPSMGAEKGEIPYFLLVPVADVETKVYIPVSEEYPDIRPVMGKKEASGLLRRIDQIEESFIESDRQREQFYKDAIRSLDPDRLVGILKNIYKRGCRRRAEGKKSTAVDDRYFKIAEEALCQELGFVLATNEGDIRKQVFDSAETW